ncbi:phage protein [[Clostridium] sordellii]|uniref:phage terminase large subunit n=1 Tax=Paraclostridium sordellii TaxID=1505 RepID=UPI0005E78D61|nr:phage terminase large subunit [Paeniclostridium sordellii]CEN84186.1 phage protein [[Clostridium] sordellii] [Paeniclostridium sordellii]CEO09606.1 phage protein [[Clostridium] sordellii] [Paeniclostridium sordellii]
MGREKIKLEAKKELARREFFYFCNAMAPDFYQEDRDYLVELCNEMQDFYYSNDDILLINMPPRHGKSRTASLFTEWVFGKNINEKVMTGSYNETLSTTFSKSVRNAIMEVKADEDKIVYSDIFPKTRIKKGDGAMSLWGLEGGYNNYLATSPGGTATGFGCSLMIVDDLIKNAEEANNEMALEKQWDWFANTMLSRLEEGGKIIIIMTRWASLDLAGRALEHFKHTKKKCRQILMKAVQDDGTMLCDSVLSKESYEMKVSAMGEDIALANYQQEPIDAKHKLYTRFSTYKDLPPYFEQILSYTDTADDGEDKLCTIVGGVYKGEGYVLDVYYTDAPMEDTEKEVPHVLIRNNIDVAIVESNNGGKSFARNIKSEIELLKGRTIVKWFFQNKNKEARILTQSSWVMNKLHFPIDWREKWPDYYMDMNKFQRKGKNKHDDAPDATTGLAEIIQAFTNNTLDDKTTTKKERRKVVRRK